MKKFDRMVLTEMIKEARKLECSRREQKLIAAAIRLYAQGHRDLCLALLMQEGFNTLFDAWQRAASKDVTKRFKYNNAREKLLTAQLHADMAAIKIHNAKSKEELATAHEEFAAAQVELETAKKDLDTVTKELAAEDAAADEEYFRLF